jgi:hypothetical protein
LQPPRIAGVAGGVGTTTLSAALRGIDLGVYRAGDPVDVLVARATMVSLGAAQRALAATPGPPPLLAVVADQARGGLPDNAGHRLRMTEGRLSAIVHVPYVQGWRHLDNPYLSAYETLTGGLTQRLPGRAARGFAAAAREIAQAITPRLDRGTAAAAGPAGIDRATRRGARHLAAAVAARTVTGAVDVQQPAAGRHSAGGRGSATAAATGVAATAGPRHRVEPSPGRRR